MSASAETTVVLAAAEGTEQLPESLMQQLADLHGGRVLADRRSRPLAFGAAPAALQAALELAGQGLCVALHTGAPDELDTTTLARTRYLLAASHPGVVMVSAAAAAELDWQSVPLYELGAHRLNDLTRSEPLFAATPAPREVPPPRTVDSRPNNLPVQPTPLIGREQEVAQLSALARRPDAQLITLLGPSGTGKTRLGLQVAADLIHDFADGARFVGLSPVNDVHLVVAVIAQTLGVAERAGLSLVEAIANDLAEKQLLIVIDNFEQVIDAAPLLAEMLLKAPGVRMLVTSQVVLHVPNEQVFPVPPLALPTDASASALLRSPAARLFLQRARHVNPELTVTDANAAQLSQLIGRLRGLPLALELTAAHADRFEIPELLSEVERRLSFGPSRGAERHLVPQTIVLRRLLDWSYDLLSADEQLVFARLSLFAGGCTSEAAQAVCAAEDEPLDVLDIASQLLDRNLLVQEELTTGDVRWMMLDMIREYAQERLGVSGGTDAARERHALFFLELALRASEELRGPQQVFWLAQLEGDYHNLRAALEWLLSAARYEEAGRLAYALAGFWSVRGLYSEGLWWLDTVLLNGEALSDEIRGKLLTSAGLICRTLGDHSRARRLFEDALEVARRLESDEILYSAINGMGVVAQYQSNYPLARQMFEEALVIQRRRGDLNGEAVALNNLGMVSLKEGDYATALARFEESMALRRRTGNERAVGLLLNNIAFLQRCQRNYAAAHTILEESLAIRQKMGDPQGSAVTIINLALVEIAQGHLEQAERYLDDAWPLVERTGDRQIRAASLLHRGTTALLKGEPERAVLHTSDALTIYRQLNEREYIARCFETLGGVASASGQIRRAGVLFSAADQLRVAINAPTPPSDQDLVALLRGSAPEADPAAWQAGWDYGTSLQLEHAIGFALSGEG